MRKLPISRGVLYKEDKNMTLSEAWQRRDELKKEYKEPLDTLDEVGESLDDLENTHMNPVTREIARQCKNVYIGEKHRELDTIYVEMVNVEVEILKLEKEC